MTKARFLKVARATHPNSVNDQIRLIDSFDKEVSENNFKAWDQARRALLKEQGAMYDKIEKLKARFNEMENGEDEALCYAALAAQNNAYATIREQNLDINKAEDELRFWQSCTDEDTIRELIANA